MKTILQLEEASMFLFGIFLFAQLHFAWWWFPALILAPDVSMLGYLFGNKAGAVCYNFFHHKAVALAVYVFGVYQQNESIQLCGIILFSHASMDRMLGYGFKTFQGFGFTHLGKIGKEK